MWEDGGMVGENSHLSALFGKHHGSQQGNTVFPILTPSPTSSCSLQLSSSRRALVMLPWRWIGQPVFKAGAVMICRRTIMADRTGNPSHRAISFILHLIPLYCSTFMLTLLTLLSLTQTPLLCRLPQNLGRWKHTIIWSSKVQLCLRGRHADDVLCFAYLVSMGSMPLCQPQSWSQHASPPLFCYQVQTSSAGLQV